MTQFDIYSRADSGKSNTLKILKIRPELKTVQTYPLFYRTKNLYFAERFCFR